MNNLLNTKITNRIITGCLVASLAFLAGCNSTQEEIQKARVEGDKKVAEQRREAAEEISRAQLKVQKAAQEGLNEVNKAQEAVVKEKHEAAKAIGSAELEATENVIDAAND